MVPAKDKQAMPYIPTSSQHMFELAPNKPPSATAYCSQKLLAGRQTRLNEECDRSPPDNIRHNRARILHHRFLDLLKAVPPKALRLGTRSKLTLT